MKLKIFSTESRGFRVVKAVAGEGMNHPEHNRNDGSPIIVGAFTLEEIKQANRKHDAEMGWSDNMSRVYTNPKRFPETFSGPVEKIWDKTEK